MHQRFEAETKSFINQAVELSYWSRGALSYEAVFDLVPVERDLWNGFLSDHLEKESKKMNPCY